MRWLKKKNNKAEEIDFDIPPRHIAVIMDGNGRWAKKRGMPRAAGHAAGAETFRTIALYCQKIGIDFFTVYAFSTENWKRPADEVESIMALLEKYLHEVIGKLENDRFRMYFFGDTSVLSPGLQQLIEETETISGEIEGCQVNICLNYGGRSEIIHAAERYAEDKMRGKIDKLTEEGFGRYMYSAGIPDPDLIIRPSGEQRLSNFMLWQAAYAELYFTDTLWPDFDTDEMDKAIAAYQRRNRRYGDVK
jgi:undecaprenyl diphosphate synthase